MPSRKLHALFTKLLLRDSFSWVSDYMDQPYAQYRHRHRELRHDSTVIIKILTKHGVRPALAAWLHLVLDENQELKHDIATVETLKEISGSSEKNV